MHWVWYNYRWLELWGVCGVTQMYNTLLRLCTIYWYQETKHNFVQMVGDSAKNQWQCDHSRRPEANVANSTGSNQPWKKPAVGSWPRSILTFLGFTLNQCTWTKVGIPEQNFFRVDCCWYTVSIWCTRRSGHFRYCWSKTHLCIHRI